MALDPAQLAQLMQAVRGGHKPDSFSSGDPVEWQSWRSHFNTCMRINQWGNRRGRLEVEACLSGTAKVRVMDLLDHHRPAPNAAEAAVAPVEQMLAALETRFLPAAASDLARTQFRSARQNEDESVLDYHARLRGLFRRAYPAIPVANINDDRNLIDTFCMGLRNPEVRSDTIKHRPNNYNEALNVASNMAAAAQVLGNIKKEPGVGLFAMGKRAHDGGGQSGIRCHFCLREGHVKRECRLLDRAREIVQRSGRGKPLGMARRGGFRAGGGRGGQRRGRGGMQPQRGRIGGPGRGGLRKGRFDRQVYAIGDGEDSYDPAVDFDAVGEEEEGADEAQDQDGAVPCEQGN